MPLTRVFCLRCNGTHGTGYRRGRRGSRRLCEHNLYIQVIATSTNDLAWITGGLHEHALQLHSSETITNHYSHPWGQSNTRVSYIRDRRAEIGIPVGNGY